MAKKLAACSESTLTDRYQTTVPDPIRKALGLQKRDKIAYTIQADGQVLISRVEEAENDPLLGRFLQFLAADIEQNPQQITAINADLVSLAQSLVTDVEVDLDAPLSDEDE